MKTDTAIIFLKFLKLLSEWGRWEKAVIKIVVWFQRASTLR